VDAAENLGFHALGSKNFGLGFIGSAAVYFWPHAKPWKHSLEHLYATDTNGRGNLEGKWEVGVSNPDKGLKRTTLFLRFRLYQDFNSNIDYISIFIPEMHNALIDEQIYGLIKWLRDQIPPSAKISRIRSVSARAGPESHTPKPKT
jgi:hypothetical protein